MTPAAPATPPPQTLLAIRLSALGDTVQTLQVLQAVAAQWPQTRITLITGNSIAPIASACPFIHEVIPFQKNDGLRAFLSLAKQLLTRRFDMVWDMHGLLRAALITAFPRSRQKWGINRKRGLHGLTYTRNLPLPTAPHMMNFFQSFPAAATLDTTIQFPLRFQPPATPPAWQPFFDHDPLRTFVIFTNSSRPTKDYPHTDTLTQLIFQQIPDARVLWDGTVRMEPSASLPADRFLNLTAVSTVSEMLSHLNHPATFIGNDSGPTQLVAALGRRLVALYGSSSIERFGPWPLNAPNLRILKAPNHNLSDLSPETILAAIQSLISQ